MAVLRSGNLNRIITIQQPNDSQDADTGAMTEGWAAFHSGIPAEIKAPGGGEAIQGEESKARNRYRVRIRRIDGVTTKMRITTDDSKTLNIDSVGDPDGMRQEMILTCRENV